MFWTYVVIYFSIGLIFAIIANSNFIMKKFRDSVIDSLKKEHYTDEKIIRLMKIIDFITFISDVLFWPIYLPLTIKAIIKYKNFYK